MAAIAHDHEPISPELVLVSPPEVASRARELLPPPPVSTVPARTAAAAPDVPERHRRRWWPWLVAAAVVAAAVVAWVESPRPPGPSFAAPTEPPPAPTTQPARTTEPARPARPAAPATTAPAHARPAHAAAPTTPTRPTPATTAATTTAHAAATVPASPGFVPARVWLWPRDLTAKGYVFELSLNGKVVLHVRTTKPRLELPRSFRFRAGTYRWTVRRLPATTGPPLTDSRFTVTPAAAALANR